MCEFIGKYYVFNCSSSISSTGKTHMVLIFLLSLESECDILVILLLICEFQALFYNLQRSFAHTSCMESIFLFLF